MSRTGLALSLISLISLAACHAKEETPAPAKAAQGSGAQASEKKAAVAASDANDAAKFLAGLPGRPGGPFEELEKQEAWVQHAKHMDELWSLYRDKRGPGMQKFQKSELVGGVVEGKKIWYPFSGGDVITMLTFFPGHEKYVMSALEPPGQVPRATDFAPEVLAKELPGIGGTLSSLLSKSFFVTREMDRQLRGQVTDGVTIPILIQLARLGYTVGQYSYVEVNEAGEVVGRAMDAKRAAFGKNRSIEFEIQREGEPAAKLLYISLNLDDAHMKDNAGYAKYIQGQAPTCTLLKATSYMLHSKAFSNIREMILERSALIMQDDSGIPWKFFEPAQFEVQLYGGYTQPYGKDFAFRKQPDLRAAYEAQKANVKPMNFRMGYGAGRVDSNLQVARKKQ